MQNINVILGYAWAQVSKFTISPSDEVLQDDLTNLEKSKIH